MKRTVAVVVLIVWLASCAPKLFTREYHQYERGYAIIISERVGEKVDVEERVHFGLLKGIDDFESAGFYDIEGGGYELIANDESQMTYFSFPTRRDVKDFYRAGKRFF